MMVVVGSTGISGGEKWGGEGRGLEAERGLGFDERCFWSFVSKREMSFLVGVGWCIWSPVKIMVIVRTMGIE